MLEKAAPRMVEADLLHLRRSVDRMEAVSDHEAWMDANREFHETLWTAAHDRTVRNLVEQLNGQVERYLRRWGSLDRANEAKAEHRAIVDALERGAAAEAVQLLRDHISCTGRVVRA